MLRLCYGIKNEKCNHNNDKRALRCTWTGVEINIAIKCGWTIIKNHENYHYKKKIKFSVDL